MVIPSNYKAKLLKKATYLSDFENLKTELTKISKVTSEIDLNLEVLHYSSFVIDKRKFDRNMAIFETKEFANTHLNIQKSNLENSLVDTVSAYVEKSMPQLLIMFTKREKSFFESLFLPSISAELTYSTKVPVLIFAK
jgi:hypothetical protein